MDLDADVEGEGDVEQGQEEGKTYALRQRSKINYYVPPPLEDLRAPPAKGKGGARIGRSAWGGGTRNNKGKSLGWSATGAELGDGWGWAAMTLCVPSLL
jgi:hypothetical protein